MKEVVNIMFFNLTHYIMYNRNNKKTKSCCEDKKKKVEDKYLNCHSCGRKLDGCCCHDYPGHFMSVETEECQYEKKICCEMKKTHPYPTTFCPPHNKLNFGFFQYQKTSDCLPYVDKIPKNYKSIGPLGSWSNNMNHTMNHNLHPSNQSTVYQPGCNCNK